MSSLKYSLFEQVAHISKALGHANRLMIIDILSQGPSDVDGLRRKLNLSLANVSKHLQNLKQAGLVTSHREGQRVIYTLTSETVFQLTVCLREVAETQLEKMRQLLQEHLKPHTPLEPISFEQLNKIRQQNPSVTLLDVRPADEYNAGHLPNAINIPIESLADNLAKLDPNQTLIVYCRGPYCMWSKEALELLHQKGYKAKRLSEGYPEWRQLHPEKLPS